MAAEIRWSVVLACPGEGELALLAELSARRDARILAVADPSGTSLGAELAEIMGIPVLADLEGVDPAAVTCLVHGRLSATVAPLVDAAAARGIPVERAERFALRLAAPGHPAPRVAPRAPRPDLQHLEHETAAIHRTLSRVEEALDRESLLRWILGLAMRAVGAGSGSLMLWDEAAAELYVGFAHGLSDATRHGTRVKAGEGIAGRVAASGQAERVRARPEGNHRDRTDLVDAVCAPLTWEGRLLGVLNLSATAADGPLADDALGIVGGLGHRLARLLHRFLELQAVADQERLQRLDAELSALADPEGGVTEYLPHWLARFGDAAGAARAELGQLTADGDLCVCGVDGVRYESPLDPDKAAVLAAGLPRALRRREEGAVTVYHLPLGRGAHRGVLSLTFTDATAAHRFGGLAEAHLLLANRHLVHGLALAARADEVERLTLLSSALSSLAEMGGGPEAEARVLAAARRLTGAAKALLVDERTTSSEDPDAELRSAAVRLLRRTGDEGWLATTLQTGGAVRSVLAVPLDTTRPVPGLLLADKTRVHPLDAAVFTDDDARFARRLLPLLRTPEAPAAAAPAVERGNDPVVAVLRREMDRCDRYHTVLGLAAFRLDRAPEAALVAALAGRLRSSDQVGCLDDGTLVVVVPEEIQSLNRLRKRVEGLLSALGGTDLRVLSGSAVYPGPAGDPEALLAAATRAWT